MMHVRRDVVVGGVTGFLTVLLSYSVAGYISGIKGEAVLPGAGAWYRALIVIALYSGFVVLVGMALDAWRPHAKPNGRKKK